MEDRQNWLQKPSEVHNSQQAAKNEHTSLQINQTAQLVELQYDKKYGQSPRQQLVLNTNLKCLFCLELFQPAYFAQHQETCKQKYLQLMSDIQFSTCTNCLVQFTKKQFKRHRQTCFNTSRKCRYCNQTIQKPMLINHQKDCKNKHIFEVRNYQQVKQDQIPNYFNKNICCWCQQQILEDQLQDHKYICGIKLQIEDDLSALKLSQTQFNAIFHMYRKSAFKHLEAKQNTLETIFNAGYSEGDLLLISQFIQFQAPLIIHIDLARDLRHYNRDTQYRNLFETSRSSGSRSTEGRKKWEYYLFGNVYDSCKPNERVKYGVMNYANDKYGITKCRKYGQSIILLKQSVRKRCTIANQRTYSKGEIVSTLKFNYPIIEKCTTNQLRVLYLASKGFEVESGDLQNFKEVHIHGPIRFQSDVECIYTSRYERQKLINEVNTFQSKFGVKVLAIQDIQNVQQ